MSGRRRRMLLLVLVVLAGLLPPVAFLAMSWYQTAQTRHAELSRYAAATLDRAEDIFGSAETTLDGMAAHFEPRCSEATYQGLRRAVFESLYFQEATLVIKGLFVCSSNGINNPAPPVTYAENRIVPDKGIHISPPVVLTREKVTSIVIHRRAGEDSMFGLVLNPVLLGEPGRKYAAEDRITLAVQRNDGYTLAQFGYEPTRALDQTQGGRVVLKSTRYPISVVAVDAPNALLQDWRRNAVIFASAGLLTSALLLVLLFAVVALYNAVHQDGLGSVVQGRPLRLLTQAALLVLPVYAGLAAYSLWLRVAQHGWTEERLWACLIDAVAALYAMAYAAAVLAARGGRLSLLDWANPRIAVAAVAVLLLTQSPLLDFRAIAVRAQVADALAPGHDPKLLDLNYLRFHAGRPGNEALQRLQGDPRVNAAMQTSIAAVLKQTYIYQSPAPAAGGIDAPSACCRQGHRCRPRCWTRCVPRPMATTATARAPSSSAGACVSRAAAPCCRWTWGWARGRPGSSSTPAACATCASTAPRATAGCWPASCARRVPASASTWRRPGARAATAPRRRRGRT